MARAVVHGDLGGSNVLRTTVDGVPRVSGVPDRDDVGIGDPAEDLAAPAATCGAGFPTDALDRIGPGSAEAAAWVSAIRRTLAPQRALSGTCDRDRGELVEGLAAYRP